MKQRFTKRQKIPKSRSYESRSKFPVCPISKQKVTWSLDWSSSVLCKWQNGPAYRIVFVQQKVKNIQENHNFSNSSCFFFVSYDEKFTEEARFIVTFHFVRHPCSLFSWGERGYFWAKMTHSKFTCTFVTSVIFGPFKFIAATNALHGNMRRIICCHENKTKPFVSPTASKILIQSQNSYLSTNTSSSDIWNFFTPTSVYKEIEILFTPRVVLTLSVVWTSKL